MRKWDGMEEWYPSTAYKWTSLHVLLMIWTPSISRFQTLPLPRLIPAAMSRFLVHVEIITAWITKAWRAAQLPARDFSPSLSRFLDEAAHTTNLWLRCSHVVLLNSRVWEYRALTGLEISELSNGTPNFLASKISVLPMPISRRVVKKRTKI